MRTHRSWERALGTPYNAVLRKEAWALPLRLGTKQRCLSDCCCAGSMSPCRSARRRNKRHTDWKGEEQRNAKPSLYSHKVIVHEEHSWVNSISKHKQRTMEIKMKKSILFKLQWKHKTDTRLTNYIRDLFYTRKRTGQRSDRGRGEAGHVRGWGTAWPGCPLSQAGLCIEWHPHQCCSWGISRNWKFYFKIYGEKWRN